MAAANFKDKDSQAEPSAAQKQALKTYTIGSVCKTLKNEFPDISISKIRYLEDQKLIDPQRTGGGYRLYSSNDIATLRSVLRLQRDEFLPLKVIREELESGRLAEGGEITPPGRRQNIKVSSEPAMYPLDEVVTETQIEDRALKELEDFGLIKSEKRAGISHYSDTDLEIIRTAKQLSKFGVEPRNLKLFRTSVDREVTLIEQLLAPTLRSRNPERRKEGVETLERLAELVTELKHLILVKNLRKISS